jgi:CBS domain-containing protein
LTHGGGVVEGRDIGSVVFPEATLKLFVTASPRVRAERRVAEIGGDVAEVEASIIERDRKDSTRAESPLVESTGAVVVDTSGRLVGVVARVDLDRTGGTAGELATARVATAVPDEPVFRAVQRMANLDVGRLPVVDPTSGRVVGVFRRADVVRAYDRGIERSLTAQMTRDSGRLRDITGLQAVQVLVAAASRVDGALVSEVRWPERTILTGVRRGTQAIVPDGSTRLQADDLVVALTAHPDELREIVATPEQAAAEATTDPSDELHT